MDITHFFTIVNRGICQNCWENCCMTKDIKKILAKNIKRLRKRKKLTQEHLSLELDFDGSYIGKIENAKMNITIEKLDLIAKYFGVETFEVLQ